MPAHNVKQLVAIVNRGADSKGFWTRIGVAFENRDGSWNLRFDFQPTEPQTTIQLRDFRSRAIGADAPATSDEQPEHGIAAAPF